MDIDKRFDRLQQVFESLPMEVKNALSQIDGFFELVDAKVIFFPKEEDILQTESEGFPEEAFIGTVVSIKFNFIADREYDPRKSLEAFRGEESLPIISTTFGDIAPPLDEESGWCLFLSKTDYYEGGVAIFYPK